ncbi:AI-2E family transporter [Paracoccus cavernae]|uniref:AI-2E family transporter n=1 Tax=Paracoccus cavernae TaxID=1571207 RepID=A0ABT8D395_9RHOB|nr:AI-2E family transporter [Paracoccus cavernae]
MTDKRLSTAFVATMVIISICFLLVIRPYYGAVFWALILALLFQPLYRRLLGWCGGRSALASICTVMTCILLVVIPFLILVAMIAAEAARAYQALTSAPLDVAGTLDGLRNHLPASVISFLDRLNLPSAAELAQKFSEFLQSILQYVAKGFYSLGQGALSFTVAFGVALYLLFFLFKDGRGLAATIRKASPLSLHQTEVLMQTVDSVLTATVKGNFIIAAVQGAIGGDIVVSRDRRRGALGRRHGGPVAYPRDRGGADLVSDRRLSAGDRQHRQRRDPDGGGLRRHLPCRQPSAPAPCRRADQYARLYRAGFDAWRAFPARRQRLRHRPAGRGSLSGRLAALHGRKGRGPLQIEAD